MLDLRDQHGLARSLAGLSGPGGLLLVFVPFAFSPICSDEVGSLDELAPAVADDGVGVAVVSCDSTFVWRAQADARGWSLPLLSDFWPHGAVSGAYGVLDPARGAPRRSSYAIDPGGTVRWSLHHGVGRPRSVEQHREGVAALLASGSS
ncbi:redoxin domain-containing protein [Nocardioidaceae bacterium]|nr:redoxin domain-containing protein [Nocardioidaceae bacterium]